jgi:hypothetical protein
MTLIINSSENDLSRQLDIFHDLLEGFSKEI